MVKYLYIATALALLGLCGCRSVDLTGLVAPPGDNADRRFDQSSAMPWPETIDAGDAEYAFCVCTDVHVNGSTANIDRFTDSLAADPQALFALILGDCIDARGMMPVFASAVERSVKPVFATLGNHDTFFSQWDDFRTLIGPSAFCFQVQRGHTRDLFISLDSASGTLGRRQTAWLKELLAAERRNFGHCIIMTHTNIFKTDNSQTPSGNFPLEETLALSQLLDRHDVTLVLQGHDHYREDITFRGVRYITVGAIKDGVPKPEYLRVHVSSDKLDFDWKYLR